MRFVEPDSPIWMDIYLDPLCPDSRAALKTVLQLKVTKNIHLFPLPYHRYAYMISQGIHHVYQLDPRQGLSLLNHTLAHLEEFSKLDHLSQIKSLKNGSNSQSHCCPL